MSKNYFLNTPVNNWSVKTAFERIEENNPKKFARENLRLLKIHLNEALGSDHHTIVAAATKLLQNWNGIKKELAPKKNRRTPKYSNNNYGNVLIAQPTNSNFIINEGVASSITIAPKKKRIIDCQESDASSSENDTWESLEKQRKKRKYINAYLCGHYGDTDIGRLGSNWEINQLNISKIFNNFRQVSIQGAQLRKHLSDSRVLSLSYIYLLSSIDGCVLSKLAPQDQKLIMKNLNTKEHLKPIDNEVMNACQKMYTILNDNDIDKDGAEEAVDEIKSSGKNKSVKIASKIILSILFKLLGNHNSNNQIQGEATLIIENIRPFLSHCIISQLEGVKYEWLTYRLALPSDGQIMIPDLTLFVEPNSATNYELFFVEVKRKGNYENNYLENDKVKLGKEMHTALNKLVKKRVRNPEIVGLLIEDTKAVAYKLTLKYDGLYQMIEISRFNFTRENTDDLLLIPAIIQKLDQIKEIIIATITNLYKCINDDDLIDLTSCTRQVCKAPVRILA